jgi:DNA polymerase-3 subunit delta'
MDILGNEDIQQILFRSAKADRLHHALLFHGPEGVGKRRMALRLAMYRTCPQRLEGAGDCGGSCPSCTRMARQYESRDRQHHPDLYFLEPEGKEPGVIKIGERQNPDWGTIRWLNHQVRLCPQEAVGNTFIIDRPERIQHEARHSLLKTLEEPPTACLIILVSSQPNALMPTIRSRCQSVRFRGFSRTRLAEVLRDHFQRAPAEARLLAGIAGGSLGRALSLDLDAWRDQRGLALEMVETAARPGWGARQTLMEMADAVSGSVKKWELVGRGIPDLLGSLLRDLVLLQSGSAEELLESSDLADELRVLAGRLPPVDPGRAYQLAAEVKTGLERNRNRRLVCEMMLISLSGIFGTDMIGTMPA